MKKSLVSFYIILVNLVLLALFLGLHFKESIKILKPLGDTVQVINAFFNSPPKKTVYGYLPYWVLDQSKYIQYDKLTDIAYFGLILNSDGTFKKLEEDGGPEQGYDKWKNSPDLKNVIRTAKLWKVRFALTIVAQNNYDIDAFLDCRKCWDLLLTNTIKELKDKGIRDINLDFEHTAQTTQEIQEKYTEFVGFMNKGLDENLGDSKVVVATFADSYKSTRISNPTELAKVSDSLFIMAYDYHQVSSENAGPVAPLNGAPGKYSLDVTTSIKAYKKYVSSNKLILGVPYYGYNILVESSKQNAPRIPGNETLGYSIPQYYSMIKDNPEIPMDKIRWDTESQTPYITYNSTKSGALRQLHFENAESLSKKYEFALNEDLAGVGIWALGYDGEYKELWETLKNNFKK